jgi:formylglycine-generating enzyme
MRDSHPPLQKLLTFTSAISNDTPVPHPRPARKTRSHPMNHRLFMPLIFGISACSRALPYTEVEADTMTPHPATSADASPPAEVGTIRSACPSDMVEIDHDYCPNPEEICLYYVDQDGKKTHNPRCGEFKHPTRCLSAKVVHIHYCIDRYEYPNRKGEVPQDWMTYTDLEKAGKALGKRVCTSSEWALAAEGPDMDPLAYGDGYHRAPRQTICNMDHIIPDVFQAKTPKSPMSIFLRSLLVPSGSMPDCHSKFGVYDMTANVDEWVVNETGIGYPTGLMSGHVFGVRNTARAITQAHNGRVFSWYETGGRLCKDPSNP